MRGFATSQSLLRQRVIQVAIAGAMTMMGVSPSQSLLRQRVIQVAKKMVVSPAMATNLNRFFVSESFRSHHHRYGHWERRGISIASSSASHSGLGRRRTSNAARGMISIASSSASHSGHCRDRPRRAFPPHLNRFFVSESFRSP